MSLLEDVFLEDEAGEAHELERIIEGDEYDERPPQRSDSEENSEKEDEAEEEKRRVDPASTKTKRVVQNPRFILNPARLTGPRGIQVIPEHFKDFKFKGKGHEKEDLDLVLKKLEHWAYRLYPKFQFEDCLKKIETLGKKRPVMVQLHKIRSDQLLTDDTVVQKDSSDEEESKPPEEDEFDKLIQQQLEIARNTPAPGSVTKAIGTPGFDKRSPLTLVPKATSSPSISDEQRERMLNNRRLAEERRLARLAQVNNSTENLPDIIEKPGVNETNDYEEVKAKRNKSNVIDSSDEDDDVSAVAVNESVSVDVHQNNGKTVDLTEGCERRNDENRDKVINNDVTEEIELVDDNDDIGMKIKKSRPANVIESDDDKSDDDNLIDITEGYPKHTPKSLTSKVIPIDDDFSDVITINNHGEGKIVDDNMIDITNGHQKRVRSNIDDVVEINDDGTTQVKRKVNDGISTVDDECTMIDDADSGKHTTSNKRITEENLDTDLEVEDSNTEEKRKAVTIADIESNDLEIDVEPTDSTKSSNTVHSETESNLSSKVGSKCESTDDINNDEVLTNDVQEKESEEIGDELMDVDFREDF